MPEGSEIHPIEWIIVEERFLPKLNPHPDTKIQKTLAGWRWQWRQEEREREEKGVDPLAKVEVERRGGCVVSCE